MCGRIAVFERATGPVLGSFVCPHCRATLRYQGQAAALVRCYSERDSRSLAELVREPTFRSLRIYEPGDRGALHRFLRELPGHVRTVFRPGAPGAVVDGVRCEDLMALTFPQEEFDLVITSDIMEHVRHPYVAFSEIHRVLRPSGLHVFTVPVRHPMREQTIERVDVSGPEDVFLLKPAYHHDTHLVYNDFGRDMIARLAEIGFETEVVRFESPDAEASTQLTFCSRKA